MSRSGRRRWVRYPDGGVPVRWWAQPLYWGLGYLGACVVANTAAALYWMSRGDGWFGSAAGQQVPILVILLVAVGLIGLSRPAGR